MFKKKLKRWVLWIFISIIVNALLIVATFTYRGYRVVFPHMPCKAADGDFVCNQIFNSNRLTSKYCRTHTCSVEKCTRRNGRTVQEHWTRNHHATGEFECSRCIAKN